MYYNEISKMNEIVIDEKNYNNMLSDKEAIVWA